MSEQSHEAGLDDQFLLENQADGSKTPVEGEIRVGRDPGCELILTCDKSSRVHAGMSVEDGALWVQDRESTNGTFVNKRKISESTRLADGDVVQFGDSRFRVVAPSQPEPEVDDSKTVVASKDSLLRMLDEEKQTGPADTEGADNATPDAAGDAGGSSESSESSEATRTSESQKPKKSKKSSQSGKPEDSAGADQPADPSGTQAPQKPSRASSESPPDARAGSETISGESAKNVRSEKSEKPEKSEKSKPAPEPDRGSVPIGGSAAGDNPSIPRSWADAERLEQASHTEVFVRGSEDVSDAGSGSLHPLKAIAQARLNTPADLAILVGLTDPVRGTLFKLSRKGDTNKWEIGRGEGADISIDDDSVSGRHAQLIHERGRWKIVNMMSVNGTFVNGRKVLSAYLNARDVIRAGGVQLVFDARIEKSGSKSRRKEKSTGASSGVGRLFTAPIRWAGRQWARLISRFRG